jgi:demethylmenaquinone methyltransferase/2-methoxy-6-polyprenyl-1,4-benzoquinol methylase
VPVGPRTRPHPVIKKHYDRERDRRLFVTALFDESARYYDRVEAFLALGSGQYYRRWTLERAGLRRGMTVLDVATGTGQMAREAARIVHPSGVVIGVDPSRGMLEEARKSATGPLVQGIGEALPFAAERFDFVSMGFALRHVSDLEAAFAEYRRVLKPGGRVLLLEITRPRSGLGRWLARIYLQKVLPLLVRITTGSGKPARLLRYYWDTIDECVPPATILDVLQASGFERVERRTWGGIMSEYLAARPTR